MKIALVGPEIEENLGLRYLASAVAARGHVPTVVAFDHAGQIGELADALGRGGYDAIGLSMMFQLRAREFVVLAERIRARGWRGTLIAGGQHATFMAEDILADNPAFDAIVLGDGERPLCDALAASSLLDVPGLVVRTAEGAVVRTACRTERTDLDDLPPPMRPREPRMHMGMATAPMIASRGCYASCSFCSIAAWEKLSGGAKYRVRPPEAVAREMATLYWERGVRVFNFHDDNFWFPRVDANRERLAALSRALRAEQLGDIALLFKSRPTDVDPDLFAQARDMGMVRIYVGIETDTPQGLLTLRRGVAQPQNQRALDILGDLDVHACSNLLLFDPDTRLPDIAHNIGFLERNAHHTLNFCRVEPYGGTPLTKRLGAEGRLVGDYLGFDYTLREPRVELLWRMVHVIFHDRNFPDDGMANSMIGLVYRFHLAKRFWPSPALEALRAPVMDLLVRFNRDQAARMRVALELATSCELTDHDRIGAFVEQEAVAIRRADRALKAEHDALVRLVERYAHDQGGGASSGRLGEGAAGSGWWHVGASLLALSACTQDSTAAPKQDKHDKHDPGLALAHQPECAPVKVPPNFVLSDAASDALVKQALAKTKRDPKAVTATSGPATLTFGERYAVMGQCSWGTPAFLGWDVSATLTGATGYELVGIAGWAKGTQNVYTRGPNDEWLRFGVNNPGRKPNVEHIAVIWRKQGEATPIVVAAAVPPDPTPPPRPEPREMRHPGCDPAPEPVNLGTPVGTDRSVHIGLTSGGTASAGISSWLDDSVTGEVVGTPTITTDFGTAQFGGFPWMPGGSANRTAEFGLSMLCTDLHVVPRTVTVQITWTLKVNDASRKFSAKAVLQIRPDGMVEPAPAQHTSLFPELPLGQRYGGTIEQRGCALHACAPHGVEVTAVRWHTDGVTIEPTGDPLVVELRGQRAGAAAVCVMDVPGGVCLATWDAS